MRRASQFHRDPDPPGRNIWRRIGWTEDRGIIIDDGRTNGGLAVRALVCAPEPGNDFAEPLEQAARRAGVALRDVLEDLEAFALLALTYMGTVEEGEDDSALACRSSHPP